MATVGAAGLATAWEYSRLVVALAATWAGNAAYFGLIIGQDVWHTRRHLRRQDRRYGWAALGRNAQALVVEFGAAEVLDSLLVRPALMYWAAAVAAQRAHRHRSRQIGSGRYVLRAGHYQL